ncbi:hypothetical protein ROI_00860 [Roseburia intestinalis M50/1]|nr:hypothetical protein ROI_00860 [Roseburia intestinalis M50/1]
MRESEASIRGRVMRDLIAHVTNDHLIGKKIKKWRTEEKNRGFGAAVEMSGLFFIRCDRDG